MFKLKALKNSFKSKPMKFRIFNAKKSMTENKAKLEKINGLKLISKNFDSFDNPEL
jgi:hypothetical protein